MCCSPALFLEYEDVLKRPEQLRPQLRDPSDEMVLEAAADDTTMNPFFVVAIAEKISAMETARFFEKRAALTTREAAEAAWGKVGTPSAMPEDTWLP